VRRDLVLGHFDLAILVNSEIGIRISSEQIIGSLIWDKKSNKMERKNKFIRILRDFPSLFIDRKFAYSRPTKLKPKTIFI
jgi:hypothetical protein